MNTKDESQAFSRPTDRMVTVYVNGLVILCFNGRESRAEMGFLSSLAADHPLELTVYNSIFEVIASYDHEDLKDTEITINKSGSGAGSTQSDPGSRPEDPEDFRWLVDPAELHGFDLRFKSPFPANSFFAKLFIREGHFFNAEGSLTVHPTSIKDVTSSRITPFRHVGRVVGADIVSNDAVEIEIKGSSKILNISLPPENGPYYVYVSYKCNPMLSTKAKLDAELEGDFHRIYEIFEPSLPFDTRRFNILLHSDEPVWTFLSQIAMKLSAENEDSTTEKTAEQGQEDERKEMTETKAEESNKENLEARESCELACQVVYINGDNALP